MTACACRCDVSVADFNAIGFDRIESLRDSAGGLCSPALPTRAAQVCRCAANDSRARSSVLRLAARMDSEELLNTLTHAAGAVLSVIGSLVLLRLAADRGTTLHVAACAAYACSLVALYAASTLYHFVQDRERKELLRLADHVCIFLMVAGTYTPVSLVPLQGRGGWVLLAVVWTIAAAGTFLKLTATAWSRGTRSTLLYVALCSLWLPVLPRITETFPETGVACVVLGSLVYAVGLVFFLNDDKPYFHTIWHLFVLAGSICHYCAILLSVIPTAA